MECVCCFSFVYVCFKQGNFEFKKKVRNEKDGKLLFHRQRFVKQRKGEKNCKISVCCSVAPVYTIKLTLPGALCPHCHSDSLFSARRWYWCSLYFSSFSFLFPPSPLSSPLSFLHSPCFSIQFLVCFLICLQTWLVFLVRITFCLIKENQWIKSPSETKSSSMLYHSKIYSRAPEAVIMLQRT